jgi:hypothetical protein
MVLSKIVGSNNASPSTSSLPLEWIEARSHVGPSLLDDSYSAPPNKAAPALRPRVLSNLATGGGDTPDSSFTL